MLLKLLSNNILKWLIKRNIKRLNPTSTTWGNINQFVKTKEGDTVGHVPDLLLHVLAPEISGRNIVSIEAIVTGEPRSAPKGTWVIGGGIEKPCKYLIYADKKLKSKIRTMLRKASM